MWYWYGISLVRNLERMQCEKNFDTFFAEEAQQTSSTPNKFRTNTVCSQTMM